MTGMRIGGSLGLENLAGWIQTCVVDEDGKRNGGDKGGEGGIGGVNIGRESISYELTISGTLSSRFLQHEPIVVRGTGSQVFIEVRQQQPQRVSHAR